LRLLNHLWRHLLAKIVNKCSSHPLSGTGPSDPNSHQLNFQNPFDSNDPIQISGVGHIHIPRLPFVVTFRRAERITAVNGRRLKETDRPTKCSSHDVMTKFGQSALLTRRRAQQTFKAETLPPNSSKYKSLYNDPGSPWTGFNLRLGWLHLILKRVVIF
jgi:hypothetical protein